ncbi:hypothetical protein DH2020_047901 [Rehmannia glutinosa]|uniref:Protein BIG GRAIN 1-like B n=1 Tax=Rehmannia glutinosa TaxID=99300 RepID=A0ABR0U862_REHGL
MYSREKVPSREENHKPKKTHRNTPSFSSSLLDEIYRSIDGNAENTEAYKVFDEKPVRKRGGFKAKNRNSSSVGDEEIVRSQRGRWVHEKWMAREKIAFQEHDLSFFSSNSSSSDSSGALSSSDTEFFNSIKTKSKVSCFMFDDHQNNQKIKTEDDLIKPKSRVYKVYANLKKVKQPISPGGRLTNFINSLFNNSNVKKSKKVEKNNGFHDLKSPKTSSPCLSKDSPKSMVKMRGGIQRTVRFNPVGVILDEDSKPCGHKSIYDEEIDKYGKPPLPPMRLMEKNRAVEGAAKHVLKSRQILRNDFSMFRKIEDDDDDDDGDDFSDSSSDLFELDDLALFGKKRFCEELPVYETTYFDKNRAIYC